VEKCVMSNVSADGVKVNNSLLLNVSAKKVQADGAILYNVVDDSDEGVVLGKGDVRADIVTTSGKIITMITNLQHDSGKMWKTLLKGNTQTFEDVYKMNLSMDITEAFAKAGALHNQMRQILSQL